MGRGTLLLPQRRVGCLFISILLGTALYLEPIRNHYEKLVILQRGAEKADNELVSEILANAKVWFAVSFYQMYVQDSSVGVLGGNKPVGAFAEKCLESLEPFTSLDITFQVTHLVSIRTKVELVGHDI